MPALVERLALACSAFEVIVSALMSEMVEVSFLPDEKIVWVRPGATLVEAGEAAGVEILTGCTRGMCGTDPVLVRDGVQRLAPPNEMERGTLERMGLGGEYRLACSAAVESGPIVVELGTF